MKATLVGRKYPTNTWQSKFEFFLWGMMHYHMGGVTKDPHFSKMKNCLGTIIVWSSKFFKIATHEG
jgi:hypothetical protein